MPKPHRTIQPFVESRFTGLKLRRVKTIKRITQSPLLSLTVIFALVCAIFTTVPNVATAVPSTCAQGGTCVLGDIGPGGGLVFYVSATYFGCGPNHADDCKYLEVAPKTWSGAATDPDLYWHINGLTVDGISRDGSPNMAATEVGLGLLNSRLIAASDTTTSNASSASRAYNGGSKNDWYLPTIAELGVLCRYTYGQSPIFSSTCDYNQTLNTGIPSAYTLEGTSYQSSSQSASNGNAQWHQNFVNAADGNTAQQSTWGYPATPYKARPIRAFAAINTVADGTTSCGTTGTFTILNKVVTSSSADCSGSVTIPYGVTAIGDTAFWQRAITSISLPNTIATIGDSSLRQTSLTSISIPGSVQSLGFLAFGTTILSSVTIASASNLATIGDYAFQSSAFTSITLPAAVRSMGTGVFQLNNNLNDLVFSGIIPSGSPWDAPAAVNISGKVACGLNGYFVIVSNSVAGNYDCRGSVNIPVGVTSISSSAFDAHPSDGSAGQQNRYGSTMTPQVTSVTIPNTVTGIGSFAFRQSSLTSLAIPNSVTSIDIYAFAFSTQITSLTFGSGLTFIGNAAFADARLVTSLTIPDGVSTIGGDAFVGATGITTLNYCGNADLTGTGLPNPSTNAGTCTAAPPQSLSATSRFSAAEIAFTPGAAFGAAITNYEYSLDGGSFTAFSPAVTTSPVSITGLTNGTTYAVRLRAVNTRGSGAASAPVNATPNREVISQPAIGGVTAPISGATPVTTVTAANGYTGTVTWSGSPTTFAPSTIYTATITLTADSGYTLTGVTSNFFTVSGSSSVSNNSNSGIVTAIFPSTAVGAPAFTLTSSSETVTRGTAMIGYTITSTGGMIASYSISPAISNTPGLAFDTSTGLISGTPTATATARTYTITATNATSPSATQTFSITVKSPPPSISIGTTSFTALSTSNLNVSLYDFDSSQNYQVTVKFVNAVTNIEVSNGTLTATQGATSLISGYTAYSGTKIGFTGTYTSISTALSTLSWTPASSTNGISIRIGISSAPSTNEFYDANSGHYYRFVATAKSWDVARTIAESTYMYGLRGYLAEINTAAENNYIAKETTAKNIWIGAREDESTTATWLNNSYNGSIGQRWIWNGAIQTPLPVGTGLIAQGAPATFSSWSAGEPNNDTKPRNGKLGPDCAVTNWITFGLWNDLPCGNGYSYLIEFGGRPNEVSTASAATLTETVTAANPILYTITYAPNNGNSTPTQASKSRGQIFTLANAITRSPSGGISYQFASWDSGGNSYRAGETITVGSSNLTFTAAWIQLYEVTYISNGGTYAAGDSNKDSECPLNICSNGQTVTLNSAPTRIGYNFAGWKDQNGNFVTDSNSGTPGIQTIVTSTNYIFSATWTIITYAVTYVSNGSAAPTQVALSTQESFTVGSDVTKVGQRFGGWSDGTYLWWEGDTYVIGTSDITLTAQWTPTYSVTYSEGTGTGTPPADTSIHLQGSTVEVPDDSGISMAGFTFGGWSDGASVVQAGAFYLIGASDVVLTAVWSSPQSAPRTTISAAPAPRLWIVSFDRNGANSGNAPDAIRVLDSSNKTISLPGNIGRTLYPRPMVRKGFTFAGWSTSNSATTALNSPFTVTSDAKLYAIWKAIPVVAPTPTPSLTTNPQPTPIMVKVSTFYMASGSYSLSDAAKKGLREIATLINARGAESILIYGHADSTRGVDNTVLSQNRAKAVARFIRPLLRSKKISIGWFSSNKPVSTGKTPADLALNRRVEIYTK
jgi:uncharacterized repeat protein (TIGR02543 family)